ncbi:polyribonucleotide nucleotidyltransferase, partial [Candidatus Saccharibacteria bacterium]|nr:polyribonucleotide nucleotidyltransferase [Candidatus Saccharibacteria bacterium]
RDQVIEALAVSEYTPELAREISSDDIAGRYPKGEVLEAFESLVHKQVRQGILVDLERPDGRKSTDIRTLSMEVGFLPRTHGSAIFTRGATQTISVATLGSAGSAQLVDTMEEDTDKRYMHHYNFPPFSVGDARPMRSAGRREIGHGALAERAIVPMIPDKTQFPYTIRVVSDITSSSGSTSMASVCGSTLSLMDAGVPLRRPVSGIAMGLVIDKDDSGNYQILSDIQDAEDFAGDMDFKVAGTSKGITALQMDIKVKGLTLEILGKALDQAKQGRLSILDSMLKVIDQPRASLSPFAPAIITIQIDPDKIGAVIGKGGETIQGIIADTGVEIDIEDDGQILITSPDQIASDKAIAIIQGLVAEPEIGKVYQVKVVKVLDFGAFVEYLPGKEGMIHISEIADKRIEDIAQEVVVGDQFEAKLIGVDDRGRVKLSKRAANQ